MLTEIAFVYGRIVLIKVVFAIRSVLVLTRACGCKRGMSI